MGMIIPVILCHPREGSFNHALGAVAQETLSGLGHSVRLHDLYAERFDPVMPPSELARGFSLDEQVQVHLEELSRADGLVIIHPDWWGQPPALLKGWIDRVLRPGFAYEYEGEEFLPKRRIPLLQGKSGLVFCTTDSSPQESRSLVNLWTERILGYCGMRAECCVFADMRASDTSDRRRGLLLAREKLAASFPARAGKSPAPAAVT